MKKQDFSYTITVNKTAKEVFDKVNQVSKWWISNVDGKATETDDIFTVSLGTTSKTFKVVELIPEKKMVWEVTDCYLPWNTDVNEWKDTRLVWEIAAKDDGVQLSFTHAGLAPNLECYQQCAKSWSAYLQESLFRFISQGEGMPNMF
jgi:hypothetical protein